jgi:DNA polymerase-1
VADETYKANRDAAPDPLRQQMGLVREVLQVLGVATCELAGWEADDIIATVVEQAVGRGDDVLIVTGDRDSYQLVSDPHVKVLYNKRGVSDYAFYDEAGIEERTGVTPALYPQYAALRGDNSDNLPGVPGVGEKTAAKLINQYGGLDGIFEHVDEQTPKLRENLTAHEERARKNVDLMLLRQDAPLDGVDFDDLAITPSPEEQKRLFDFLEFRTLGDRLAEVLGPNAGIASSAPRDELVAEVTMLDDPASVVAAITTQAVLDVAAVWEGEPGRSPLTGIAIVTDPESSEVAWIAGTHLGDDAVAQAFGSHDHLRGHNVKPLMRSLLEADVDLRGLRLDVAIAAYLIDPAEARYELADLLEKHTAFAPPSDAAASGQLDLDGTAVSEAQRAGRDALAVHHIAGPIEASLEAHGMADLYHSIENPLVRVLARMEHVGVGVDGDTLRSINQRLTAEVESLAAEHPVVAERVDQNHNSPTQLRAQL